MEPFPVLPSPRTHLQVGGTSTTSFMSTANTTSDTQQRRKTKELFGDNINLPDKRLRRRKVKSLLGHTHSFAAKHTWILPLLICSLTVLLYLVDPVPSNPVSAFLFLSYALPQEEADVPLQYGKGARDFAFVGFFTVFLIFTREFLMQRLIRPLAVRAGVRSRGKQARFLEQAYTAIYFGIFGPLGVYVMSKTPVWYFDTAGMFQGFPHRSHTALFKSYYLLQASYWAQQMLVMVAGLEKPRKDFKELAAHHVVTLSLIWLSYRFHFTYMGLAVYITHDISDCVFAVLSNPLPSFLQHAKSISRT
jgi:acyl-CoA-dependent ceramide synthase